MRALLLAVLLAAPLQAQLHLGIKGGVPFNDAVKTRNPFQSEFSRWTLGGVAELDLPAGLGLELDLLFRRTGYSVEATEPALGPGSTGSSWEFPLLLKYRFPGIMARPYLSGGLSFRHIADIPNLRNSGARGVVLGAGLRINAVLVRVSPELRYTRWNSEAFQSAGGLLGSSRNQLEVLVGLTF